VPANYHPQLAHGLLVMLPAPGPVDRDKLAERWKMVAEERQLIVLVPMSATSDKWEPTETEFIRKTLDDCLTRFNIDRSRLAVYGHQTGGTLAWLFGCENIDRVRAIVAVNATPPQRLAIPDNDPINRLAFFIATAEKSPAGKIGKQLAEHLSEEKFPVTEFTIDKPRDLSPEELSDLGRWLDALDRI
jgi:predicted esterase